MGTPGRCWGKAEEIGGAVRSNCDKMLKGEEMEQGDESSTRLFFFPYCRAKKSGGGGDLEGKINKTWPAFSSSEGC